MKIKRVAISPCPDCDAEKFHRPGCVVYSAVHAEAAASCSLDGSTQHCEACLAEDWLAKDISDFKQKPSPNAKERVFDSAMVWFSRPAHNCMRKQ